MKSWGAYHEVWNNTTCAVQHCESVFISRITEGTHSPEKNTFINYLLLRHTAYHPQDRGSEINIASDTYKSLKYRARSFLKSLAISYVRSAVSCARTDFCKMFPIRLDTFQIHVFNFMVKTITPNPCGWWQFVRSNGGELRSAFICQPSTSVYAVYETVRQNVCARTRPRTEGNEWCGIDFFCFSKRFNTPGTYWSHPPQLRKT